VYNIIIAHVISGDAQTNRPANRREKKLGQS